DGGAAGAGPAQRPVLPRPCGRPRAAAARRGRHPTTGLDRPRLSAGPVAPARRRRTSGLRAVPGAPDPAPQGPRAVPDPRRSPQARPDRFLPGTVRPQRVHLCGLTWLFMEGAPSAVDLFDPKPELDKSHGKRIKIDVFNGNPGPLMRSPFKF